MFVLNQQPSGTSCFTVSRHERIKIIIMIIIIVVVVIVA